MLAVGGDHLGRLKGGWLGVEVFFVLSGFLITCLLLGEDWTSRRASRSARETAAGIGRFYARRAGRLLPALVVVVGVVLAYVELRDPAVTHLDADSHERLARRRAAHPPQLARRAEGGVRPRRRHARRSGSRSSSI